MFQKYFFSVNYLIIIVVGIIYFFKIRDSIPLKLWFGFIVYSFITEVLGSYIYHHTEYGTSLIYNMWGLISYLFYSYFILNYLKTKWKRKIVKLFALIMLILFFVNATFYQNVLDDVFSYNTILGRILICVIVVLYFEELLKSDNLLIFKRSMSFWVILGVFIYAIGSLPVYVIGELIAYQGVFRYVFYILNVLMAVSFITGFVASKSEFNTGK